MATKKPVLVLTKKKKPVLILTKKKETAPPVGGYNPYHVGSGKKKSSFA